MDYETSILCFQIFNPIGKTFNIILKCELDLIIFVQILEVSPQFRHNTVHIVTALTVHI